MSFQYKKHVRYWRLCANLLPDPYVSNDASRVSLGFFIVAGLDLLDLLPTNTDDPSKQQVITDQERLRWIDWIYECQIPDGEGFRGFTGTDLGERRNKNNQCWDPGNLPNTFFALGSLLILGDDLSRVQRDKCLGWLSRMQRSDGSFGETLGLDGKIEGGRDLRYCCCAAGIAFIFHNPFETTYKPAFDEDRLIDYILSCQNYNGGYGESPLREPHSGLNYCAIATLELISRLRSPASRRAKQVLDKSDRCVRWMLDRQTTVLSEEEVDAEDEDENGVEPSPQETQTFLDQPSTLEVIGFNGRENKIADTCYCFWNSGALAVSINPCRYQQSSEFCQILNSLHVANLPAVRQYLLAKVQHTIGGFAKDTDSPPGRFNDLLRSHVR